MIAGTLMLIASGSAHAARLTAKQKCKIAKFGARGDLVTCLEESAADVIAGKPDKSAKCKSGYATALTKIDAAATSAGTSCRYIDNGNGTVSDLNTGLMWEKKSVAGDVHDVNNLYTWSATGTAPDGMVFTSFLASLNDGVSSAGAVTVITGCLANYCDWRLPSIVESLGIVDLNANRCGTDFPCIDPIFGPTQPFSYWSATSNDAFPDTWDVFFYNGGVSGDLKTGLTYARAVRGGL